ncbi:hypothetical protein [Oceanisphaera ostreae]|uniref:Glycosyltransferase subfamily 4-like N-terminal domain-containing protein n=1 Tax=Oceanisphaera ostreae TaxID=914151 RepID=A0ABW3KGC6_9GAMM
MNIVILSNRYPPDLRVAARRWGGLVPELIKKGNKCTMISAGDGTESIARGANGETVICLPISNQQEATSALGSQARITLKQRIKGMARPFIPLYNRNLSSNKWLQKILANDAACNAIEKSDVLIASYGPMQPLSAGVFLAKKFNKPLVVDIRDSFESKDLNCFFWARWLSRKQEKKLLKSAALRVTVGARLASHLENTYNMPFEAVYNGWAQDDLIADIGKAKVKQDYLYYAGSIYEHQLPALKLVLEATAEYPILKLRLRLLRDNTEGKLEELINNSPNKSIIEILPPTTQKIVTTEVIESNGVLVLEKLQSSPLHDGTVTGKLFQLIALGKPGFALCSPTSEIAEIVRPLEHWFLASDIYSAQRGIDKVLQAQSNVSAKRFIEPYSVEVQGNKMHNLLSKLTSHNND